MPITGVSNEQMLSNPKSDWQLNSLCVTELVSLETIYSDVTCISSARTGLFVTSSNDKTLKVWKIIFGQDGKGCLRQISVLKG